MQATFRNRVFDIKYINTGCLEGSCCDESELIEIHNRVKGLARLDAEIHESLHACLPMLEEKVIDPSATDIARFLWKLGYRMREPK